MDRSKQEHNMNDLFSRATPDGRQTRRTSESKPGPKNGENPSATAAAAGSYPASDIEVLEGLEPVRRRPGMYVGGTDETALHHLAAEILDNAMDGAGCGQRTNV